MHHYTIRIFQDNFNMNLFSNHNFVVYARIIMQPYNMDDTFLVTTLIMARSNEAAVEVLRLKHYIS